MSCRRGRSKGGQRRDRRFAALTFLGFHTLGMPLAAGSVIYCWAATTALDSAIP